MRRRSYKAFTLVELLVVIGIISVLIAILLPALAKAREHGNRAACLSNLRQLTMAVIMYSNENAGHFPLETRNNGSTTGNWTFPGAGNSVAWPGMFRLDMYNAMHFPDPGTSSLPKPIGAGMAAWQCPSNPNFYVVYSMYADEVNSSYMYLGNGWAQPTNSQEKDGYMRPTRQGYKHPVGTVGSPHTKFDGQTTLPIFGDKVEWIQNTVGNNNLGTFTLNHKEWSLVPNPNSGVAGSANASVSGANLAYTDGHAEWVLGSDLQPQSINNCAPGVLGTQPGSNASFRHTPGGTYYVAYWWY